MESSITDELKRTFDLASLRHEASQLRTPADWERANEIRNRYKREANKQEQRYFKDYDTRVRKILSQLIDKAGAKDLTFKHRWFGSDNFNKDNLTRKAHRFVQMDQQRRLDSLSESEAKDLGSFMKKIKQRDQLQGKSQKSFERATNRRTGSERRQRQKR